MASTGDWWKEGLADTEGTTLPGVFPVVMVSQHVHELIRELELAAGALAACPKEEIGDAYAHLSVTRSTLYRYLQDVERKAKVKLTHIMRF